MIRMPFIALAALLLCGCGGAGPVVRDEPQDINVSPRSMEAYDPAYRDLEKDDQ